MAVKMRLRREGKRKQPFYRVVVADVRSPRDGRFIDDLGYYQPLRDPSEISIDRERALYWLRNGVQPSDAVRNLLRIEGIWEEFKPGDQGKQRPAAAEARAKSAATASARDQAEAPATADGSQDAASPQDEAEPDVLEQAREEVAQPGTEVSGGGPFDDDPSVAPQPGGEEEATS